MSRRRDPARIHAAHRAAHLARLHDVLHIAPERAEELVTAWEAHAGVEGRQRGAAAFWEGADTWIAANRRRL